MTWTPCAWLNHVERQGYSIVAASNGRQALTWLHAAPDLILLDLMMPISAAQRLPANCASADTQDVPIIMFTAKSALDDKLKATVGADDYLTSRSSPKNWWRMSRQCWGG
jgi:CheY-like chemotaxis protein